MTFTTVFKRAITYKNWLIEEYLGLRFFEEINYEMTIEYLNEKAERKRRPARRIQFKRSWRRCGNCKRGCMPQRHSFFLMLHTKCVPGAQAGSYGDDLCVCAP